MMTIDFVDSCVATEPAIERANIFAKTFPQSLGARKDGRRLVLTFVKDERMPADKDTYRKSNIDRVAVDAYRQIFEGEDEIDLLLRDKSLVFSILFWNGRELSEVEFAYPMNELLLLADSE